jgi:hypothetical protein
VTVESGLSCAASTQLLARFLEDYDGVLPKPWRVVAEGAGKASFTRGSLPGFSVKRVEGAADGGNTALGKLCPGSFTVNAGSQVGPLSRTVGFPHRANQRHLGGATPTSTSAGRGGRGPGVTRSFFSLSIPQ